ncbi:MAG: hypothetical protein WBY94_06410, partial [Polyangiaceae bacterium]
PARGATMIRRVRPRAPARVSASEDRPRPRRHHPDHFDASTGRLGAAMDLDDREPRARRALTTEAP